jgi:enolase
MHRVQWILALPCALTNQTAQVFDAHLGWHPQLLQVQLRFGLEDQFINFLKPNMSLCIQKIDALEILDSRGNPTVRVTVHLDNGVSGTSSVASGASIGTNEAWELRDGDIERYGGKGVLRAVENVRSRIAPTLKGCDARAQDELDMKMIALDGTANKTELGANAILGVSQAIACAAAKASHIPLYRYLGGVGALHLPVPMMNVLNGGKHADSGMDFQEYMIFPVGAATFAEALRYGAETFQALRKQLTKRGYNTSVGDEGGFAPQLKSNEEACELIVESIVAAGYRPGIDIAIALDPAASSFYKDGVYRLERSGEGNKSSNDMVELFKRWVDRYPIISIEDGHAEDDWAGFQNMTAALGSRIQIVGDDNLVTNPAIIARAIEDKSCNAALIKLNQIGTVSETIAAVHLCRGAGWGFVISHRSGETEDTFMSDFAVAMGGGQIKSGSLCRSERMAKYNRLLEIERELGSSAVFGN